MESLGTILSECSFGSLQWHDENRICPLHGSYFARVVLVGGKKVSDGFCPECETIKKLAEQKASEEAMARLEAEKARRRLEDALGRACIPADFKDKSHLAISIIKALLPDVTALYTRVPDMIGYIRAMWRSDSETSSYAASRHFVDLDLLVLDELGVQSGSANEQALLFEVIDARLSENRPTIFLSNLSPKDLRPIIGERLVDRIKGKCVPQRFIGESRRKPLTADVFD